MDFKTIILTTDLSENANAATPYAVSLAKKFSAPIQWVHVFEDPHLYSGLADGVIIGVSNIIAESHKASVKKLEDMARGLANAESIAVKPVLLRGNPIAKILEFADKQQDGCIVIATHGRTGLSHAVLGSVAERIVRMSTCPVLSVRPKTIQSSK
jgi:nucleotide-binding universal stress UspA family protein